MNNQQNPGDSGLHRLKDTIAYDLSLRVAPAIGARPHECFANAWSAFIELPDLFRGGTFVEGWLLIECEQEVQIIEHGWCVLPDEQIVDPSIVLLIEDNQRVLFFPGVRRTWRETEALEGEFFPHVRFDGKHGDDGLGNPDYNAAYETAVQIATTIAASATSPKTLTVHTAQPLSEESQDEGGIVVGVVVSEPVQW